MMGCVPPRAGQRIELVYSPERVKGSIQEPGKETLRNGCEINGNQVDEIVEGSLFDGERAIHDGFADIKAGSDEELPV